MLLNISRPAIPVAGAVDPVIEDIVNLMPDYSAGSRLHDLYVNKLQSALPGNYSQLFGTGPSFRSVFFPDWQPDPLLSLADGTGLSDAWWSAFSVAVLCQAIAEMGSNIRGQMLTDKINGDVTTFNVTLSGQSSRVYAKVLEATYSPLTSLLQKVNPATAKQQFHDSLLNNVLNRQLWYQAGMWTSPDWEMFNQYAKYIILGASDAEVDALIGELMAEGLPVPAQVGQGAWRSYAEELRDKPDVDVNDISAACSGPVTATTYIPNPDGYAAPMPDGNCYEFTADSQPGSPYRRPPGGCCFTGDTRVLDGDGNAVPLRRVKQGDTVLTRDGVATVAYVARPLSAGRKLHRLGGGGPVFVATHPFLNGAPPDPAAAPPALLSLEPQSLAWTVPTLSEDGIGTLEVGSTLWSRAPGAGQPPVSVTVAEVEEVTGSDDDPYLYDLRLATSSGARQEFWAGQDQTFYLVSPEYPILGQAGAAATTVVAVMEGMFKAGGPDGSGWPSRVIDVVNQFGAGVFHGALMQSLATTPSFGAPVPPEPIYDRIERLYRVLDTAPPETAAVVAGLFDGMMSAVGQWLASVVTLGWRTSMLLRGDVLAVTVFDIALTPASAIPADTLVRMDVTVKGRTLSDVTCIWDRRGRTNTRFHRYFDQLVHLDMAGEDRPDGLSFAVSIHGAPVPILFAEAPGAVGESPHRLQSAVLRNSAGKMAGTIRFDTRRLSRHTASNELTHSGLWTEDAANAYADALGAAMVGPILSRLREMAPAQKS